MKCRHFYMLRGQTPVPVDDALTWGWWFEEHVEDRRVALDTLGDVEISTVFLGLDHNWGHGPPLLFETMVFRDGQVADEFGVERYSTWEEAEMGHTDMLARVAEAGK